MEMSFNVKSRWRLDGILMMIPYSYNDDIYMCHIKLRWRFKSYNEDFSESHQDRVLEEKLQRRSRSCLNSSTKDVRQSAPRHLVKNFILLFL